MVCGGGNNAGDGYVAARLARQAGLEARILTLVDPAQLGGDLYLINGAMTKLEDAGAFADTAADAGKDGENNGTANKTRTPR